MDRVRRTNDRQAGGRRARFVDTKVCSLLQIRELNATGVTTMSETQLELIYGADSPWNNTQVLRRLRRLRRASARDPKALRRRLRSSITQLAEAERFELSRRRQDFPGVVPSLPVISKPVA